MCPKERLSRGIYSTPPRRCAKYLTQEKQKALPLSQKGFLSES
jgi:hypothetical protein